MDPIIAPDALPSGWVAAPLDSLVLPVTSAHPADLFERTFTYLDIGAIDASTRRVEKPRVLNVEEAPSRARRVVHAGDILVSLVRPYLRTIAEVPEGQDWIASTGFCVLRPGPGVSGRFLYYLVQSQPFTERLNKLQRGVSYPAISEKDVKGQLVGVPPAAEQARIAMKLDRVLHAIDEATSELSLALSKLELLRRAWIDEAFNPGAARAGNSDVSSVRSEMWARYTLGEVCIKANYGTSQRTDENGGGPPVLRIPNISSGKLDLSDLKFAVGPLEVNNRNGLTAGDLLVIRTNGSLPLIGRAVAVPPDLGPGTYFASYLIRLRFDTSTVLPEWMELLFSTTQSRRHLEKAAATTAGQYNINLKTLRAMSVPVPPLAVQRAVIASLKDRLRQAASEADSITAALQAARQDRENRISHVAVGQASLIQKNDEPVGKLLERVAAAKMQKPRHRDRHPVRREGSTARMTIEDLVTKADGWMDAQSVFDTWFRNRVNDSATVETFYVELSNLIHAGRIEITPKRNDDGVKLGDLLRRRSSSKGK